MPTGTLLGNGVVDPLWGYWSSTFSNRAPGWFTADAYIAAGVTATVTADAIKQASAAGSLSANAIAFKTTTGTLTANAVVRQTVAGSFSANAVIKATVSGSLTADAIRKRTYVFGQGSGGTVASDTFTDSDETALTAHTPNLGGPWVAASGTGPLVIRANALYIALQNPYTGQSSNTQSARIASIGDGSIESDITRLEITGGNSATIKANTRTWLLVRGDSTFSSFYALRRVAGTDTVQVYRNNNVIIGSFTSTANRFKIDATGVSPTTITSYEWSGSSWTQKSQINDNTAGNQRATGYVGVQQDGYAYAYDTGEVDGEGFPIFATAMSSNTVDNLSVTSASGGSDGAGLTLDAMLRVIRSGTFSANAIIKASRSGAITADAIVRATVSGTFTADARLAGRFVADAFIVGEASHVHADAILRATISGTVAANAVVRRVQTASLTANAVVFATLARTLTADAVKRTVQAGSVTANADIRATRSGTITADAVAKRTATASLSANAVIKATRSGTIAADAVMRAVWQASLTASAVVSLTPQRYLTADAVLRVTRATTFTADALLRRVTSGTYTADAFVLASTAQFFTANAVIRSTRTAAFSANAIAKRSASATFSGDARFLRVYASAISADAVQLKTVVGSATANAVLRQTRTDGFAATAVLLSVTTSTFTAQAVIRVESYAFTANALLRGAFEFTFSTDASISPRIPAAISAITSAALIASASTRSGIGAVTSAITTGATSAAITMAALSEADVLDGSQVRGTPRSSFTANAVLA